MFEWDNDNVIVTGSSDGVVRVSYILCQHVKLVTKIRLLHWRCINVLIM